MGALTMPKNPAILRLGSVPLPVGRAGFKPVGGRVGVLGRFDSCLFRVFPVHDSLLPLAATPTLTMDS
jgi:hypothetical protein